jgi:signal transduction histidine kinase
MRQIRATVGRMDSLVGDLFDLSRLQGGRPDRDHQPLSVAELIIDLAEEVEPTAQQHGVALLVDLPEQDRLAIDGDADDLARALGNLISNAIDHTATGGTVAISADRSDHRGDHGAVRVAVTDRCGGIPAADLAKVFDAGWRGDPSRTGRDGAGLGLAIARGVLEAHGGAITVRNTTDGCCFEASLPARTAATPQVEERNQTPV